MLRSYRGSPYGHLTMHNLRFILSQEQRKGSFDCWNDVDQNGHEARIITCDRPELLGRLFDAMKDRDDPVHDYLETLAQS